MHAVDHFQAGQAGVADLGVFQRFGDDADHLAARSHGRIGNDAHQADGAATIHQRRLALGQGATQGDCRFPVDRIIAGAGAAKNTNCTKGHWFTPWSRTATG
ncbi:hypothetical protein D9M73_175530 [compost metagenome]